jgi:NAD(P)-dependent dehydrogenase (short-subunit alcohol dehydrogenase family)
MPARRLLAALIYTEPVLAAPVPQLPQQQANIMPTHVVVGASRGIGYAFLQVLSKDSSNTVIGLVRDTATTQNKLDADGLDKVTIFAADLTDYDSLRAAAAKVSNIVEDNGVDYLWEN